MSHSTLPSQYAADLEGSYARFRRFLDELSPEERTSPVLEDEWSPLALAAHVAFWDRFQLRRMQAALSGAWVEKVPWPSEENEARARRDGEREWEDVVAEADEAREALVDFASRVTPEQVERSYVEGGKERPVLKILLTHMSGHAIEHGDTLYCYLASLKRWGREGFRTFYRKQYDNFVDGISGLSEESCLTVPVEDEWCVREMLVHVLSWDEYCESALADWSNEDDDLDAWRGDDFDQINRGLLEARADLDLIQILDRMITVHRRILRHFDQMSDAELMSERRPAGRRPTTAIGLLYRMSLHRAQHAVSIWQARQEGRLRPVEVA